MNWSLAFEGFGFLTVALLLLWIIQLKKRDAGLADLGWAVGVGGLAVYYAIHLPGWPGRRILVAGLAGLWALRLALHLIRDRLPAGEDFRYRSLREKWGSRANSYFLILFLAQPVMAVLLSLSFLAVLANPSAKLGWTDAIGVFIWAVAIVGESVADRQLRAFRRDPQREGRVCRRGLWRFSRHPNYFFEWVHWWAYVPMTLGLPTFGWSWLAPALMLLLLLKVTGVPPAEASSLLSRGEEYRRYQQETSVFFPWFPGSANQKSR